MEDIRMIYDSIGEPVNHGGSEFRSDDFRDEFTLGFEKGYYLENSDSSIERFSVPKGNFPEYQSNRDDGIRLEKSVEEVSSRTLDADSIEITSSEEGSKFDRDLDPDEMNLVGSSFDIKSVRNRWIDAVENLLDLAGYAKGQLNSTKRFDGRIAKQDLKEPEKWMLLPDL